VLHLAPIAILAIAVLAVMLPVPPPSPVTEENLSWLRMGMLSRKMTRADVEAILGPPGDYRSREVAYQASGGWLGGTRVGLRLKPGEKATEEQWLGDTIRIRVLFNAAGLAADSDVDPATQSKQGTLDHLVWRAKRQWRQWFPG
jgi:hypothetical protein